MPLVCFKDNHIVFSLPCLKLKMSSKIKLDKELWFINKKLTYNFFFSPQQRQLILLLVAICGLYSLVREFTHYKCICY